MSLISALYLILLASVSLCARAGLGPITDLPIVNRVISPDGFNRSAVLANGEFPGTPILATKGDKFEINVQNFLEDPTMVRSTTIHWHGLFQHGSETSDGTASVSQCPIAANHSYIYKFSVPDQAGTYWYHSHLSTQYCDGLRGPIIIYDPDDPYLDMYDVDNEETILTLADWYHSPAPQTVGYPPYSASTLFNGLGRYEGGPLSPLSVTNVEKGKRYRIRLLSLSCDPNYVFSIDGHNMTIIEVDGVNHEPLVVDSIDILAGQRYSFILNADQPVDNYWMRAVPNFGGPSGFENGTNSAILRYAGAPIEDPTTNETTSVIPLNETDLHPLVDPAAPGEPYPGGVDIAINLPVTLGSGTEGLYYMNNATFYPYPEVPVLLQVLSGAASAQDLLPPGSVYALPRNKTVEVSMPLLDVTGPHPMHLHGHNFSVVRTSASNATNYVNPVRRDVVDIGTYGDNVTIRFTTNNPGPWFLHCHVDFHLLAGFAVVFVEDTEGAKSENIPKPWQELCPIYDSLSASQLP